MFHGIHAYTSDGHTGAWLSNLRRLSKSLKGFSRIYPGHGSPGGLEILGRQKDYLVRYRKAVEALRLGKASLTEDAKKRLVDQMKASYPQAGQEFLIALGADAVAAELAQEEK